MNMPLDWCVAPQGENGRLAARGLHVSMGGRRILQDVSITARAGRVLALVGPNGAGKSSLLTLLAGLRQPSLGEVRLDGRDLREWLPEALARRRGMLSQKAQLGFAFRVDEVVLLGRSPHGERIGAIDHQRAEAALAAVQALHLRERNYLELSGGEQQRVQLARVLAQVCEPAEGAGWLLLDEPEASLDVAHQHGVLAHARQLAQRGYGVIAVLHDLNLAASYADDVGVLSHGRLLSHGSPEDALDPSALSRIYGLPLRRSWVDTPRGWIIHPG
ncbi:heme ABC transporter ATP-binding protein [Dyella sp.]|uniref:heme ABC transporter ATP-binding protein n=1 Tax=Dyella sp. TaxID=1869338 RepID=UPI002ED60827